MLLDVGNSRRSRFLAIGGMGSLLVGAAVVAFALETRPQTQQAPGASTLPSAATAGQSGTQATAGSAPGSQTAPSGLNIVVLDPAHGGTDPGARGTGGIQESEITLEFAAQVRHALEQQGLQVVQTRQANDNPSFDDRSAIANAQRGAVFISLHIASTGIPGTVRVYVNSDLPSVKTTSGFIPWELAQAPFLGLSRKLGDLVQGMLTQHFKGSPDTAQTATIRQLRTTAAPAIAVEVSSVVVNNRADLDHMAPAVADAIARGVAAFKPLYAIATASGALP